jgi:hypothetical protein
MKIEKLGEISRTSANGKKNIQRLLHEEIIVETAKNSPGNLPKSHEQIGYSNLKIKNEEEKNYWEEPTDVRGVVFNNETNS